MNTTLRFTVAANFSRMLQKPSRSMVIYDVEDKIAWQVPTLIVVSHVQNHAKTKYGHVWSENDNVELPKAILNYDGGKSAAEAILEARRCHGDFVLHKETSNDGSSDIEILTLSSFIKDLYYRLFEATSHDPKETKKVAKTWSNLIWGMNLTMLQMSWNPIVRGRKYTGQLPKKIPFERSLSSKCFFFLLKKMNVPTNIISFQVWSSKSMQHFLPSISIREVSNM